MSFQTPLTIKEAIENIENNKFLLPSIQREFSFDEFPPFFEGLLPEVIQLDALLRQTKIDRNDFFSILLITGKDLVGSVTLEEVERTFVR